MTVDNSTAMITTTPTTLPAAEQFVPYSSLLTASGGRPDYLSTVATGSNLPAWLTLASDGVVSGMPPVSTTPRELSFIAQVLDGNGAVVTKRITMEVQTP